MGICLKRERINRLIGQESDMTTSAQIRILTVDDHPLLQEGLAAVIESQPDMVLVGQASNCRDALQQIRKHQPDVTLMDLRLPDMSGIDALIAIQAQFPDARMIMMTTFEGDGPIQRALQSGACSYILKNMPPREIVDVIRQVHAGKRRAACGNPATIAEHPGDERLTDREVDILRQAADEDCNRDIANRLSIAKETGRVPFKPTWKSLVSAVARRPSRSPWVAASFN
jgi:DNA-binding NarL/FixJ family response regulator